MSLQRHTTAPTSNPCSATTALVHGVRATSPTQWPCAGPADIWSPESRRRPWLNNGFLLHGSRRNPHTIKGWDWSWGWDGAGGWLGLGLARVLAMVIGFEYYCGYYYDDHDHYDDNYYAYECECYYDDYYEYDYDYYYTYYYEYNYECYHEYYYEY